MSKKNDPILLSQVSRIVHKCARIYRASEDDEQEALIAAWQALDKFDPAKSSLDTFVACIARRTFDKNDRKARLRELKREVFSENVVAERGEHNPLTEFENLEAFEHALSKLPPSLRDIAETVMYESKKAAMEKYNISRTELDYVLDEIGKHFVQAGIKSPADVRK